MCTHLRRIKNRYTGDDMFVKCGKCDACQMEKANARAERIRTEYTPDYLCLFVTLTYDKTSCPFVYLNDLYSKKDILPVYRAFETRFIPRKKSNGSVVYVQRRKYGDTKLCDVISPSYDGLYSKGLKCLQKFGKRVGVAYYKDLQDFYKRLRINLLRNYGCSEKFKVFSCSEYGPKTQRPHFHLLMFIRPDYEEIFREAIVKSWPFASEHRTAKYIELARDAASYVASYVNCSHHVHPFLSQNFKIKHSSSKYFGHCDELFSLPSLLEMLGTRDLSFAVASSGEESELSFVPLPKYVINRFFPLFKGASRLSDSTLYEFILDPSRFGKSSMTFIPIPKPSSSRVIVQDYVDYSSDEVYKIWVRLNNAFEYYHNITGKSREDFALDYIDIWHCYRSTCFRLWRSDTKVCDLYKFDNLVDLVNGVISSPYHVDLFNQLVEQGACFIVSPNFFPQNVSSTRTLSDLYLLKDKSRKVINTVMAFNGHYV